MKANCVTFKAFGDPENVLNIEEKLVSRPSEGQILVRMKARPINPSDLIPIRGAYANRISLPCVPGYEGIGVVEEVGSEVPNEMAGKRVLPLRGEGTWQDYVKASAELAVPVPDEIDDLTAAQIYINPVTAWIVCTEILKVQASDVLLVNAGGSSLARIFAQLSRIFGFRMIAVTRNGRYTEELLRMGVSDVVNTSKIPLKQTVKELTNGQGATAAIDSVGGSDGTELAFCVQPGNDFLTIGLLSGVPVDWKLISKRVTVRLFHLRHWNQKVSDHMWQETFEQVMAMVLNGQLTLMPGDSFFDLGDVRNAVRSAQASQGNKGKIFLIS